MEIGGKENIIIKYFELTQELTNKGNYDIKGYIYTR